MAKEYLVQVKKPSLGNPDKLNHVGYLTPNIPFVFVGQLVAVPLSLTFRQKIRRLSKEMKTCADEKLRHEIRLEKAKLLREKETQCTKSTSTD